MGKHTALYDLHIAAGGRIVDFGGWDMPLHYGSQIEEHHRVRSSAGVFDVSHMTVVDVTGADSTAYLHKLLANNVDKLSEPGRGLYSCMLNPAGGVIDDLIVYRRSQGYRLIVNAATREQDLVWMRGQVGTLQVTLTELEQKAMLAVQGPEARVRTAALLPPGLASKALELQSFCALEQDGYFIARTGYTGEDGWEIVMSPQAGIDLWIALRSAEIHPCGLGARDTLRLEAGLNLYGQDMDLTVSPLSSNLGWTVAWEPDDRQFIGRTALEAQRKAGVLNRLVGLVLEEQGVMRASQRVRTAAGEGCVTSGSFSPTMQVSIALARLPKEANEYCDVDIRGKLRRARIVQPPFVRNGRILIQGDFSR